jgi:hypothetical protein
LGAGREKDEGRTRQSVRPDGTSWHIFVTKEVITHYLYVTVEGERPQIKDWEFVATIDHTDELNIIRGVPGAGDIPVRYRKSLPICDHCKTTRRRTETFVLRNVNTEEYKQVGRNCLADFFGGDSPQEMAAYLEWWTKAVEILTLFDEESFGGGGTGKWDRYGIENLLLVTRGVINTCGWMSRTKAREQLGSGVTPTADIVADLFQPPKLRLNPITDKVEEEMKPATPEDVDFVNNALEWVRSLDPEITEDYLYNLYAVCRGESVRCDGFGLACSLLPAYRRFLDGEQKRAERAAKPASQYVGTVGERQIFRVTVKYVSDPMPGYNDIGTTTRVVYEDEQGNSLIWWATSGLVGGVGETLDIVATVKKHQEYRPARGDGTPIKQTVIARVTKWNGKPLPKKRK